MVTEIKGNFKRNDEERRSLVACGLGKSASVACIAETIEALGRSDIRAGETEWRN